MDTRPPEVACPQCGAPVPLAEGAPFVPCPHCRASLYVDLDRLVRHVVLTPRLGAGEARGALERFLLAAEAEALAAGRDTSARLEYLPWYVVPARDGRTFVAASPDAALAGRPNEARDVGDAKPFGAAALGDAEVVAPTISLEDAVEGVDGGRREGAQLVHVPMWRLDFADAGARYAARVDAVDGDVAATKLPPSSSRRMDRAATQWLVGAIVLFALEAAVLPGFLWPMAAFAATGVGIFYVVRASEGGRR